MANDKKIPAPKPAVLDASIEACLANADRLIDDAVQVEFQNPPCTKLVLSMIAQEEYAKAFVLALVRHEVIPWSAELLRALNDHACKQLVNVIIEYIDPQWESVEEINELIRQDVALDGRVPQRVSIALNILRHEKIGRWESSSWDWTEPPQYDAAVLKIAEGQRDKVRQDALYVRLGRDGSVASTLDKITAEAVEMEYAKARQFGSFVVSFVREERQGLFYDKVRDGLKVIFQG